jgi:predicted dehydrogenase
MKAAGRRRVLVAAACLACAIMALSSTRAQEGGHVADVRLMTLDPGHFHAALVQKSMYPGVAARVDVYAPLGSDLVAHLGRVAAYNTRADSPTSWQLEVHTGPDFLQRMVREKPGNLVVISGRNRGKIERILDSVRADLHVLADKPWVLRTADLPTLEAALADADAKAVVAYDIMTERFEITTILQRALVNDESVFGKPLAGTSAEPGVYMESVHHLMKMVSGAPNIRPAWFFDTAEQGEGFNDIGTHLVDLVQWTLFPGQAIDVKRDVRVDEASRWPTKITEAQFKQVTGEPAFPKSIGASVHDGVLDYYCNTLVGYELRGIHVKLNVIWDWEAPAGSGDRHYAVYRGSRARVEVRQSKADGYQPELYVVPDERSDKAAVAAAVSKRLDALARTYTGIALDERRGELHITIPEPLRVGHEAHFAQVMQNMLKYVRDRKALPSWERPNMIAKYFVTTTGTELSRRGPDRVAPRLAP